MGEAVVIILGCNMATAWAQRGHYTGATWPKQLTCRILRFLLCSAWHMGPWAQHGHSMGTAWPKQLTCRIPLLLLCPPHGCGIGCYYGHSMGAAWPLVSGRHASVSSGMHATQASVPRRQQPHVGADGQKPHIGALPHIGTLPHKARRTHSCRQS